MLLDALLPPASLHPCPSSLARPRPSASTRCGATETQHDPFLPLALAAEHTQRLHLGTAIAVAFARSPAVLAYTAWDLADASRGRFILGLGTQVKAHIERRFGMPWPDSPAGKLRDLIDAMRALWRTWQEGERLNHRGPYHKLTLMTPFFNPGPIEHPAIPIYIAGVNPALCRLAGEVADGFVVAPLSLRGLPAPGRPAGDRRRCGARRTCAQRHSPVASPRSTATDDAEAEFRPHRRLRSTLRPPPIGR